MTREPDGLGRDRSLPYMTGLSAQRLDRDAGAERGAGAGAAAIAYTRLDSVLEALLVLVAMIAISTILRRPGIRST